MKVEYVCHACLCIDTGDIRFATDPWFEGPAYCGQWNVFPKPVNAEVVSDVDAILLSHGHEDHTHVPTLKRLSRRAKVFYPYNWYGGITPFLNELGFRDVAEATTHKKIAVTPNTSVTYITNNLDSIVVIESGGKVVVNVNDALHSYPLKIVDSFVQQIQQRWPKVEAVFCGFGGASYFPNTVHCPGKDDKDIALAREQMFVQAFCRIVHGLNPAVAVPFAADFVLLRPNQRWINDTRFPRQLIPDYYRRMYGDSGKQTDIRVMYPGDVLDGTELRPQSPYRSLGADQLNSLIEEQYGAEIRTAQTQEWITESEADRLGQELLHHLARRVEDFDPAILAGIRFSLKVPDLKDKAYFNIRIESGKPHVERSWTQDSASLLEISVPSRILSYSLASEWGGDGIIIGYGCEVQIFKVEIIEANLDSICIQLLTRLPRASSHWKKEPFRMARHVLSSPFNRNWAARVAWARIAGASTPPPDYNAKVREWLVRGKCESCGVCDLPTVNDELARML